MPWCHSCNAEFRETMTQCPTCNIALDAAPAEVPDEVDDDALLDSEEELFVAARGDFATCLDLRKVLHAAGVPCALVREELDADAPAAERLHPRYEVLLPVSRTEDAQRALGQRDAKMLENEGLAPVLPGTDGEHCPACGFAVGAEAKECPDCGLAIVS